ncbi:MAG TPA: hypothetical protein VGI45_21890 [Terracidiphilus sp.]
MRISRGVSRRAARSAALLLLRLLLLLAQLPELLDTRTRVKARAPTRQRLALMRVRSSRVLGLGPPFIGFVLRSGGRVFVVRGHPARQRGDARGSGERDEWSAGSEERATGPAGPRSRVAGRRARHERRAERGAVIGLSVARRVMRTRGCATR